MATYVVPVTGYLLSEDGHARLCRLAEHLGLLAELARGYVPPRHDAAAPIEVLHWAASLADLVEGLDGVLGCLEWQGEALADA